VHGQIIVLSKAQNADEEWIVPRRIDQVNKQKFVHRNIYLILTPLSKNADCGAYHIARQLLIAGLIVNTQVGFAICGLAVKERIHKLKVDSSSYI
jgi:hypothetical protein